MLIVNNVLHIIILYISFKLTNFNYRFMKYTIYFNTYYVGLSTNILYRVFVDVRCILSVALEIGHARIFPCLELAAPHGRRRTSRYWGAAGYVCSAAGIYC